MKLGLTLIGLCLLASPCHAERGESKGNTCLQTYLTKYDAAGNYEPINFDTPDLVECKASTAGIEIDTPQAPHELANAPVVKVLTFKQTQLALAAFPPKVFQSLSTTKARCHHVSQNRV